jgi:5-(aminomethyl)-3-furanmethanol phosphate kinase
MRRSPADLVIVKLGGSLHVAPALGAWLRAVATGQHCIVVPGGGPFADAVRRLQGAVGFDDLTAHRMAILAMQQYGLHLQALVPRLTLAETEDALLAGGSVWLPWRLAGLAQDIAASWNVTSDSLALWLARRLAVPRLLLVKAAGLPKGWASAEELAAAGILDPAFGALLRGYAGVAHAAVQNGAGHLTAYLAGEDHPFTRIEPEVPC